MGVQHKVPPVVPSEGNGKKKGLLDGIRASLDDKDEQLQIISTLVRLGVLIWSGCILTLAYVELPPALGIPEQRLDPTFIASIFTSVIASFGLDVRSAKKNAGASDSVSKKDIEALIAQVSQTSPHQIIRIEHAPVKIVGVDESPKPPSEPPIIPTAEVKPE